jgi:hypothetical protein
MDMEKAIREHAYHLWIEAGRPEGNSDSFWLKAQREILVVLLGTIAKVETAEAVSERKRTRKKPGSPKKQRAV